MTPPPTFRCADAARDRNDPLLGTAPLTTGYLLIEHIGPWRFDAVSGAGWSAEVNAALGTAARKTQGRLLLIRRPGRRQPDSTRAWAVVRAGVGTHWGSWQQESDLLMAAEALRGIDDIQPDAPEPLLLVCAHGVHDACCAIRGRPIAAALADRWPAETWECSHVGGDRFAGNLVMLPDGTYYGGLDAEFAVEVAAGHLAGRVDVSHLRGSVRWPPVAQVAVGEIHRRWGPYGAAEVSAESWTALDQSRWVVHVVGPGNSRYAVEVLGEPRPTAELTCAATRPTAATGYRVVSLTIDP